MKEEPSCSGTRLHTLFYLNHGASRPNPTVTRHRLLIEVHHVQETHP